MKGLVKACCVLLVALWLCAAHLSPSPQAGVGLPVQRENGKKESESIPPDELARAKTIFGERCARCHGADGRGQTVLGEMLRIPDFTDETWWQEEKSNRRFITSIRNGKGDMPAFGRKLSKEEISSLAAYVRRFQKPTR